MRRRFLKQMIALPFVSALGMTLRQTAVRSQEKIQRTGGSKLKIGLNAYSFNAPLTKGGMNLDDMLEFCAQIGLEAVDLTGYYFPGYPNVPPDEYIYHIKRKAFLLGLDISGTGVRNDFTFTDAAKRKDDVTLVKKWIDVASKLGAPVIRVFAGKQDTKGYSWDQVAAWLVNDIRECVEYGKQRGVIIGIQNHNDFIKTSADALKILKMVDSEWAGIILDTGSFHVADPYTEIAATAPYAVNWQIKENVFVGEEQVKVDLPKLLKIIRSSGYRGYLPIETLGEGDPKIKVPRFLEEVRTALSQP
ncbi:MAG: sugar phosphate isomerase/epimerase [Ignavibacteriales bacterium]|nr:sugar phosphate isomerase/epimerase [Ignavibacteriales bacterium]